MVQPQDARILIVDDDDDIRTTLVETLEDEGYRVLAARNGQEALSILQNGTILPSLILLDMMMPVMDGPSFRHNQLQDERLAAIPVVIVTADSHVKDKAFALSATAALKKPLSLAELFTIAQRFCGMPAK